MPKTSEITTPSLREVLRKHFLSAALGLLLLLGAAALLMIRFRPQLDAFTVFIFDQVGIGGLAALLFFTDAFVSPFPPDSVLVLIAASEYHRYWPWLLPLLGALSSLAGCLGYACGRGLSNKEWAKRWLTWVQGRSENVVERFGPWGVALGALTPLPFSITCWTAGILHLPFRAFIGPCFLRIPRYVGYYVAIAFFPRLFS